MSEISDVGFSDTFDNISFSESGRFFNLNCNATSHAKNVLLDITSTDSVTNVIKKDNISVDDSMFLIENATQPLIETINTNNNLVDSSEKEVFSQFTNDVQENNKPIERLGKQMVSQLQDSLGKTDISLNDDSSSYNLSAWGLPELILQKYSSRGIKSMFSWQVKCLKNEKVLCSYSNLIYSAPTSAGKTLVAEILLIKNIVERKKKVIFILPFISTVREKMFYFRDIFNCIGIRVEGFMGSYNPPGGFKTIQVAVCTIEKANGIINRLMEENALDDLGAVIVDEIHLIGDFSRGYLLELMLTKLRYMSIRNETVNVQIVGMSATLPNVTLLGKWLNAELFTTDYRPIPLYEKCLIGDEIHDKNFTIERILSTTPELGTDTNHILQLCLETIDASCSVLIFCPTKNWCENLALQIAQAFWKLGSSESKYGLMLRKQLNVDLITEVIEQLTRCPVGLDSQLRKSVSFGVAFHHAGLTLDERDIIESAFRNNSIRILIATSTLSSGVNLPARRVIIRTPHFHGSLIDSLVYRQMIGRAGRMGKDSFGESILICQKNDTNIARELLSADLKPIESCLEGSGRLKRAILEVVASGVVSTPEDVSLFANCTLYAVDLENCDKDSLFGPVEEAMDFLIRNEFIRLKKINGEICKYVPTSLGKACLSSSMPPEEGLTLFAELEKARQCFVLETELHLVYIVTPYNICNQWVNLDWMLFLELWEKLPVSMKRVGELVGVTEAYIISGTRNKIQTNTNILYHKLQIHKRFFTALALQDLVNEVPLNKVASKFGCTRGMLQSLQQSASTFAGMLTAFSRQLGWSSVEILISQFQDRLNFGVSRDLLELMKLGSLNGPRARALYNIGIEGLSDLASADVDIVENALFKIGPFESEKEREGETKFDASKRNKLRSIWVTGKEGLTEREAALMLIEEARRHLQLELGLVEAKWEINDQQESNKSKIVSNNSIHNTTPNNSIHSTIPNNSIHSATPNNSIHSTTHHVHTSQGVSSTEENENKRSISQMSHVSNLSCNLDNSLTLNLSSSSDVQYENNRKESIYVTDDSSNDSRTSIFSDKSIEEIQKFKTTVCLESPCLTTAKAFENLSLELGEESKILLEQGFRSSFDMPLDLSLEVLENSLTNEIKSIIENESRNFSVNVSYVESDAIEICHKRSTQDDTLNETAAKKRKLSQSSNFCKLQIVDVCGDEELFWTFCHELLEHQNISLSFACEKVSQETPIIGSNLFEKKQSIVPMSSVTKLVWKNHKIVGVAISWGNNIVYYLSLADNSKVALDAKLDLLEKLFIKQSSMLIGIFDCKEQMKLASRCFNIYTLKCQFEDPKVADWIICPEGKEKNINALTLNYFPTLLNLLNLVGDCKGVGSISLDLYSQVEPRIRASVESLVTWHLCKSLYISLQLQNVQLLETYKIEMSAIISLLQIEIKGLGVSLSTLQSIIDEIKNQCNRIEQQIFSKVGYRFSLISSKCVSKALNMQSNGRKLSSTNKQALETHDSPLAKLILIWRKLNCTLTKMIYPLMRLIENGRISGIHVTHTATGRISMHEPNIQNIAKDFDVEHSGDINSKTVISCRSAFVPEHLCIFLSADYCQLELRILAHFSKDPLLISITKSNEDIFKSLAAKWKQISVEEVDTQQRQWVKQLCYGIIYGMGKKNLAGEMKISEQEAEEVMTSFFETYPNLKKYIEETISLCRLNGYVETLAGRKRFLPNINHDEPTLRSQGERQAVNTRIQGTAADVAKRAMIYVEQRFRVKFRHDENLPRLVLHLHDELLYEVPEKYLSKAAVILKKSMEEAVKLSVPLPVKLKFGPNWAAMREFIVPPN